MQAEYDGRQIVGIDLHRRYLQSRRWPKTAEVGARDAAAGADATRMRAIAASLQGCAAGQAVQVLSMLCRADFSEDCKVSAQ
jgi:hypothetical protein